MKIVRICERIKSGDHFWEKEGHLYFYTALINLRNHVRAKLCKVKLFMAGIKKRLSQKE